MVTTHIVKSYDEDLKHLNDDIARMGELTINQINKSVTAILERNAKLAEQVIQEDSLIDRLEHDIDTFAIRMIALRQPVARDLRNVVCSLKISSHLERIADYAVNLARRALQLQEMPSVPSVSLIPKMTAICIDMIRETLQAYFDGDDKEALKAWHRDQEIDDLYTSYLRELLTYMMEDARNITPCTQLLFAAKNIERMGDHTTDIAEQVYYLVHGTLFQSPIQDT